MQLGRWVGVPADLRQSYTMHMNQIRGNAIYLVTGFYFVTKKNPRNLSAVRVHNFVENGQTHVRFSFNFTCTNKGHAAAQLVEALRYKPEGREFDSRWCHWNFSLT